ncbi:MAG TPA: Rne/Rng family ribonuclease [Planctomycetota bacterium]|nr:Rne/Rng family ribonuclease [Planctomycetota bacterium]HUW34535.1 Rne/Rng family ribonuclease [Planctomycetota bacterium]
MKRKMLINVSEPEETRIAVLEDGALQELYIERASAGSQVGNIFKAKVLNVEPSIQAAFVDLGKDRNGFLHVSDIMPGLMGRMIPEGTVDIRRKQETNIHKMIKRGQEVLVQITKDGIGSKGPSVTSYLSLPGRYLVMMPGVKHYGVSRKIADEQERTRLKRILNELELLPTAGFIVRTAGVGRSKRELQNDLRYVLRLWSMLEQQIKTRPAPACVYQESDLITRSIRDFFTTDIEEIIIDTEEGYRRAKEAMKIVSPGYQKRVRLYDEKEPLFHKAGIEDEIERLYRRRVPLKSGGSIVIEPTEALVPIDVNSGTFTEEKDAEETAFKTNLEAAVEVARQLRLRDLGGVIVIDFIDMRSEKHKHEVEKTLYQEMKRDRARSKILKISRFGLVQMTRQRMRPSVKTAMFENCPNCSGAGIVRSTESMVLYVLRQLRMRLAKKNVEGIQIVLHPRLADVLLNKKRRDMIRIEDEFRKNIQVTSDPSKRTEDVEFVAIKE